MSRKQGRRVAPSRTGRPLKVTWGGVITDNTVTFYINDTLSKHSIGDIVYKPTTKTGEHEYLLPLDGQTIDGTKYKRLVDYMGSTTLPDLNGRYLRADSTPGQMVEAGLPNITGEFLIADNTARNGLYAAVSNFDGAFWPINYNHNVVTLSSYSTAEGSLPDVVRLDASKSNSIYGNSTTVTPSTYTVRAFICYA